MRPRTITRDLPILSLIPGLKIEEDQKEIPIEISNGLCGDPEDCQGCGWCLEEH